MKSAFRAVLVSSLLACPLPTQAAPLDAAQAGAGQADEAQFYFLRGNRAYQEQRFEDALASYYLSNRLVANRNVQFNIARCLGRLGRYEEAYRAWSTLLEQALPEKEEQAAREAIEGLRPHLALVVVKTTPPGATISAGRRDLGALGTTPKRLALPAGKARIILDREGFRSLELVAEPVRGQEIEVAAVLDRVYGQIDVRRVPASAEIRRDFLDGEILRHGPGPITVLPGPQVLFVSAPGFESERVVANALPDATVPVDVLLSPSLAPTGTLVVRANVAGALIRIDGKESGFAPAVIDQVPTGLHRVEILAEGRHAFAQSLEVKQGERTFVEARLGRADPEVTAATKSQVASESAPASISIITADQIAAMGYTTLGEAVASVRGAFTSDDRSYESVGFYGFSPPGDYTKRVLILVDGHPVNDAVTGQGYVGHDFDVDLANVARIEIVRGPGSVLYGTGALFGVINVVTRRASEGAHASLAAMAGTTDRSSGRATASLRRGQAECTVSLAGMRRDGDRRFVWPAEFNGGTSATVLGADGESAAHVDLAGRLGPLSLRAGWNDRRKDLPTGAYGTLAAPGTSNRDRRAYAELRFDQNLRGFDVAVRAAYDVSSYHGRFNLPDATEVNQQRLKAEWLTGELRLRLPQFLLQRFTLGAEVVTQLEIESDVVFEDQPAIPRDLILSAYLVDDVRLGQRLGANLGVRIDSYTKSFGTLVNPRLALMGRPYRGGNTKLFFGGSFRAPSPNERANNPTSTLRPETIWSGELEHGHAITDDVRVTGVLFANWLRSLITLVEDPVAGVIYVNQPSRVRSIGVEGEVRWEPGGGTLLTFSVTRQQVVELTHVGNLPFLNAPDTMVKAALLCPLFGPTLRFGSEMVLDSGRHFRQTDPALPAADSGVDDALLWNLSFSGEYRPLHLRYVAGIFNLLDVRATRSGYPTGIDYPLALIPRYGRSLRAGLAWSF